jgi:hypothetical protein
MASSRPEVCCGSIAHACPPPAGTSITRRSVHNEWGSGARCDAGVPAPSERSIEIANVELDVGYYDRGITARREAHTQLTDVTDILDGTEDEADKLLADLLALLD